MKLSLAVRASCTTSSLTDDQGDVCSGFSLMLVGDAVLRIVIERIGQLEAFGCTINLNGLREIGIIHSDCDTRVESHEFSHELRSGFDMFLDEHAGYLRKNYLMPKHVVSA